MLDRKIGTHDTLLLDFDKAEVSNPLVMALKQDNGRCKQ